MIPPSGSGLPASGPKPDFRAIRTKAAEKRAKRASRVQDNAALASPELSAALDSGAGRALAEAVGLKLRNVKKLKPVKSLIKRGPLKSSIIRLLGLLDRKKNGPLCRIGESCPQFQKVGHHYGTLAYHLVPAQRGDATRFIPANVVWACSAANYGEVMNRSLYREKHVLLFGRELIEGLEATARGVRQFKMSELLEMRENLKRELEAA